jgi:hypothetical protein
MLQDLIRSGLEKYKGKIEPNQGQKMAIKIMKTFKDHHRLSWPEILCKIEKGTIVLERDL